MAGTAYTYDDNGNLAFDGQFRYYYDCESRLIDINDASDAPIACYAYDYLGGSLPLLMLCSGKRFVRDSHFFIYILGCESPSLQEHS